jgi:hypothetical protein
LICSPETLVARWQARPAWRGCDSAFITDQLAYLAWFQDNATTAFAPPLTLLDTTHAPAERVAERIRDWAISFWQGENRP